jgi:hypothetical protein
MYHSNKIIKILGLLVYSCEEHYLLGCNLEELGTNKDDLAICGGASGGDLLFAESCLQHGLSL